MPESMPAGGYVTDLLLFVYVAVALLLLAHLARRAGHGRTAVALAVVGALTVVTIGAECWLRYGHDRPRDGVPTLTWRAWLLRHWTGHLNPDGFRGPAWPEGPGDDVERIVLLGDEVVAGWGVNDVDDLVAQRLESDLGTGYEVRGVAVPGWNTGSHLTWLARQSAGRGIDRVVLVHALDDVIDLIPDAQLDVQALGDRRPSWWNPSRSFLFDEVWARLLPEQDAWRSARIATAPSASAQQTQIERARRTVETCRRAGFRLDVIIVPWLDPEVPARGVVADAAVRVWREAGAASIFDLRPQFAGREAELRVADELPWPNAAGHEVLAESLAKVIRAR